MTMCACNSNLSFTSLSPPLSPVLEIECDSEPRPSDEDFEGCGGTSSAPS